MSTTTMMTQVSEKFDLVYHEAYCFIAWIPENVPAFAKARVSTHQVKQEIITLTPNCLATIWLLVVLLVCLYRPR